MCLGKTYRAIWTTDVPKSIVNVYGTVEQVSTNPSMTSVRVLIDNALKTLRLPLPTSECSKRRERREIYDGGNVDTEVELRPVPRVCRSSDFGKTWELATKHSHNMFVYNECEYACTERQ